MAIISISVTVRVKVEPYKDGFNACAIGLDVWANAGTKDEALESLKDALEGFLGSCFERGVLDKVLRDCGYEQADAAEKQESDQASHRLTVPLSLIAQSHGRQNHAY